MNRTPGGGGQDGEDRTVVDRGAHDPGRPGPPRPGAPLMEVEDDDEPGATMMIQVPTEAPGARDVPKEAHLIALAGNDTGQVFPLRQATVLVGRGLNCSVVLNDPSVSRRHFNILRTPEAWKLIDLGSGNGTRVDGVLQQEIELREGARIEIGITALQFSYGASSRAASPSPSPRPAPQPAPPAPVIPRQPEMVPVSKPAPQADPYPPMQVVSPQVAPPDGAEEEEPRSGGGKGLKIIVISLTALVVGLAGFLAADKFAGLGLIFKKTATTGEVAEPAKVDAGALQAEGIERMKERDWAGALEKLEAAEEAAKAAGSDDGDIRKAVRKARAERDAASDHQAALDAMDAGNQAEGRRLLLLVPEDSVYYLDAQEKLRATQVVEKPPVDASVAKAAKLFDAKDFVAAAQAFREASTKLEDAKGKSDAAAKAEAVEAFGGVWSKAEESAGRARHDEAVEKYEEAGKLNESIGGGLGPEIEKRLAAVLVARGQASLRKKNVREAAADISRAKSLDPDSSDVALAEKKLLEQLEDVRMAAITALGEMKNDEALALFELIQSLVGDKDPRWAEAAGFIQGIKEQQRAEQNP